MCNVLFGFTGDVDGIVYLLMANDHYSRLRLSWLQFFGLQNLSENCTVSVIKPIVMAVLKALKQLVLDLILNLESSQVVS